MDLGSTTIDIQPPSTPTNLQANAPDSTKVNLTWTASTDNVGVTGYKIYKNGSILSSTVNTNYTDTSVSSGTTYSYYVTANDAAGNISPNSSITTITVPIPTAVAPIVSSYSVTKKTTTTATITWTTNVPTTGVINYGLTTSLVGTTVDNSLTTTHTAVLSGLNKASKYYYKITATNSSGLTVTTPVSTFRTMSK